MPLSCTTCIKVLVVEGECGKVQIQQLSFNGFPNDILNFLDFCAYAFLFGGVSEFEEC